MNKSDMIRVILSQRWPGPEELVDLAERRFGFGGDDGAYGIVYPGGDEGRPSERELEFYSWECDVDGVKITEQEYLVILEGYLTDKGERELAERVSALQEPSPAPVRPFLGKSYSRPIPLEDLRLRAQEALVGAVPPGLRAVSTEIRGHVIHWRCIFESDAALEAGRELLLDASYKVMGLFYHHADMKREFRVVSANQAMEQLACVLFQRYE